MTDDLTTERADLEDRARTLVILLGIVFPVLVTSTGVILTLLWLPEVPDPAATHWSSFGPPDGFGPAWTYPAMVGGLGLGLTALLVAMVAATNAQKRPWGPTSRFLAAFMPGAIAGTVVGLCCAMAAQRGLSDASEATSSGLSVLAVPGVWAVITVLFWFLQPRVPVPVLTDDGVEEVAIAPTQRAVWMQSVTTSPGGVIALCVATLAVLAGAIVMALAGTPAAWLMLAVAALLILGLATMVSFRVRVDERGLSVVSVGGWPRFHTPLADITDVSVAEISPMADFGGWGVRYGMGRGWGVILRAGEAIVIRRSERGAFTVVVPDAARGAGVLEALRRRRIDENAR